MKTTIQSTTRKKLLQVFLLAISICFINSAWAFKAGFTYKVGSSGQVTFTSTSTGTSASTVYYWYPGDGSPGASGSGMTSYKYTYAYNGSYYAVLYITDSLNNQFDSIAANVNITNSGTCNLTAGISYTTGANGQVNYTTTCTGTNANTTYTWYFGDGGSSSVQNPSYTFTYNGTYYNTLTVSNGYGCSTTVGDSVVITNDSASNDSTGNVNCTLNASFTATIGNSGAVTFNSTSTGLTPGTAYYWYNGNNGQWMYSDSTSTFAYTYPYNGTYITSLYLYNANGCNSVAYDTVVITNSQVCNIHANFKDSIGANGRVFFTSTSTGTSASTYYYWSSDSNGYYSSGGTTFTNTYPYNGTYGVTLYVEADSNGGCFSDTTIYVTVTNALPCSIHANITDSIGANGQVTFTNTSTGMTPSSYAYWNLGNGQTVSGSATITNITSYANGTYAVNLYVTADSSGLCSSDTTIYITITNSTDSLAGGCSLNPAFTDSLLGNGNTMFISTSTGVTPNTVYTWNAGDGSASVSGTGVTSFAHAYTYNGTYYATLSLYDSTLGCSNSVSSYISITTDTAYNPYDTCLYANFMDSVYYYNDSNGTSGNDSMWVYFYNTSDTLCYDSNHGPVHSLYHIPIVYSWNYGDGSSASNTGLTSCQHLYTKAGTYVATLTINHQGSTKKSSYSKIVTMGPAGINTVSNPEGEFKLYPNPNNGTFRVAIGGIENSQNAELQITNILGEVIYTTQTRPTNGMILQDISLPSVNSGTYFVRVITADKVYNTKTVITR